MNLQNLRFAFAACLLLVFSCKNQPPDTPTSTTAQLDSLLTALDQPVEPVPDNGTFPASEEGTNEGPLAKIIVPDESKYSKQFLTKLSLAGLASEFELADSLLIVEKLDTFLFPMEMPLKQWSNFIAVKHGYTYSLDVARLNFTTLGFNFELRKGNQTIDQLTGKADLNPGFFLGSESDEDPVTGVAYFCDEYYFSANNCDLSIRLGGDDDIRKVKIIKTCKNSKYNIDLDDCPVLLEKL